MKSASDSNLNNQVRFRKGENSIKPGDWRKDKNFEGKKIKFPGQHKKSVSGAGSNLANFGRLSVNETNNVLNSQKYKWHDKEEYAISNIQNLDREINWMTKMEKFGCVTQTAVTNSMINSINCKLD